MFLKAVLYCWIVSLLIASPVLALEGPTDLSVYSPTLSWCPAPAAVTYRIFIGSVSNSYDKTVDTSDSNTVFHVANLQPGTYYFKVAGILADTSLTDLSNEAIIVIAPPPLPGPAITIMIASSITTTSATITWVTNTDCSGTILYGTDPQRLLSLKANNLGTTDHLGVITGLLPKTHYFYKARSTCGEKNIETDIRSFNTK